MNHKNDVDDMSDRIKGLNDKGNQLLLFLSFALVAGITLEVADKNVLTDGKALALSRAIPFWVLALFPILISILPVRELFHWFGLSLNAVRRYKAVLLFMAILAITVGSVYFLKSIW